MPDSVFNRSVRTNTIVNVPEAGRDNHIPINQGAATGNLVTKTTFLNGIPPGQDQVLIHSDNQVTHIDKDQYVLIQGQLIKIVDTAETRVVKGRGRTTDIQTMDTRIVNGENFESITGTSMRTTIGGEIQNEVSSWFNFQGPVKIKLGGIDAGIYALKGETTIAKLGAHVVKKDDQVMKYEWAVNANKWMANELSAIALSTLLVLARPKIGVLKPNSGGISAPRIIPFS